MARLWWVVDRSGTFYPPAANAFPPVLQKAIIVRAATDKDECWALEQALRCPDVEVVIGWPHRLTNNAFRRLQLAAEHGGGLGLLIRSAHVQHESSWASVRIAVTPQPTSFSDCQQHWRFQSQALEMRRSLGRLKRWNSKLTIRQEKSMTRILALWLPNWPIQRLIRTTPELKQQPLLLYQASHRGRKVVACSHAAWELGVRAGMPFITSHIAGQKLPPIFQPVINQTFIHS